MQCPIRRFVAVVDDDESVRRAFGRLLGSFGYDVEVFSSGDALLASLAARTPDCVLLDLHMPGLDGFETQARLAKCIAGLPVVVITGQDTASSRTRAFAGGARAYLQKPVDARSLFDAVRHAMGEEEVAGGR
jgi:FixJ family two-component response regulator